MRIWLALASAAEGGTGLALLVAPEIVAHWLLGSGVAGAGVVAGRVAGIALIGLGAACWPSGTALAAARRGMLTYGVLVTLYLAYTGMTGAASGPLLWPAVALHVALCILLARPPVDEGKAA